MIEEPAARTPRGRPAHGYLAVLVLLAAATALLIAFWDWNWFKGPIERRVSAATGRPFEIKGPLEVDLGRVTIVRLRQLSLESPRWSLSPEMARADLLRIELPVRDLLRGERRLRRVDIVRPALLLERTSNGTANWDGMKRAFGKDGGRPWRISE